MFTHFLRGIADYAQRVGRQVPEQVVKVAAIQRPTWDVLRYVGDGRVEIGVQRRKRDPPNRRGHRSGAAHSRRGQRRSRYAPAAPDLWTGPAIHETSARGLL